MDYKKKYEQALENLKRIKTANEDNKELVNFIEYEYPELKKSEDERIRKAIIKMVSDIAGGFPFEKYGIQKKEALAWLEKQDKKDSQVILPTFTFDDILALQCCMKKVQKDEELYNQLQILHDRLHDAYWLEKQGEQKPEIKYIYPKFRVGDVIEPVKPNGYCAPVRVKYIGEGNYSCESDDCKSFLSFPVCNENEYVLTEQKPAWSEEDEVMLDEIIDFFENGTVKLQHDLSLYASWLKSLKERMKGE